MRNPFGYGAFFGLAAALAASLASTPLVLIAALAHLASYVILMLACVSRGKLELVTACATGASVLLLLEGTSGALLFLLSTGVPAILLGDVVLSRTPRKRLCLGSDGFQPPNPAHAIRAQTVSSPVDTQNTGPLAYRAALLAPIGIALAAIVDALDEGHSSFAAYVEALKDIFRPAIESLFADPETQLILRELLQNTQGDETLTALIERITGDLAILGPLIACAITVLRYILGIWLASRIALRFGMCDRFHLPMAHYALPMPMAGIFGTSFAIALLFGGWFGYVASLVATAAATAYLVQGLVVFHRISTGWTHRRLALVCVYVGTLILGQLAWLVLCLLGLADQMIGKRFRRDT